MAASAKPAGRRGHQRGCDPGAQCRLSSLKFSLFQPMKPWPRNGIEEGEISGIGHERWRLRWRGQVTDERNPAPPGRRDGGRDRAAVRLVARWRLADAAPATVWATGWCMAASTMPHWCGLTRRCSRHWAVEFALAPLHQPHNLAAIRAIEALWPQVPQVVACSTPPVHRSHSQLADLYAHCRGSIMAGSVRRYGFHGLLQVHRRPAASGWHRHCRGRDRRPPRQRCQPLCVAGGPHRFDHGFFLPLDGRRWAVVAARSTRCAALSGGRTRHEFEELEQLLYRQSGLLRLSDSVATCALLASSEPRATGGRPLRAARTGEIGALTAMLGGVDALVFTGGMGETPADSPAHRHRLGLARHGAGQRQPINGTLHHHRQQPV